jgi:photoactive yellow protein
MSILFADPGITQSLDSFAKEQLDALTFGVVRMDANGVVVAYNNFESQLSGLSPERVIGKHFFRDVAPCTNNYLVASRYADEPELDHIMDYVFTLRMRATSVKLRLLRSARSVWHYLLVQRVAGAGQS